MTETSELSQVITTAIRDQFTPEFVQKKINARVEQMVEDAITSAVRSYGTIGKLVQESVEESLKVDRLDLPSYGHLVTTMLQAQIEAVVSPLIAGQLAEDMESLLQLAPKTIKLSEIVESMMEDKDEYGEQVTCIVETNEYGSTWISLDETVIEPDSRHSSLSGGDRRAHRCDVRMLVSQDGKIFSATFRGADMKTIRTIGDGRYGLEQRIRAFHACGTVIEIDEDAVVTYRDID